MSSTCYIVVDADQTELVVEHQTTLARTAEATSEVVVEAGAGSSCVIEYTMPVIELDGTPVDVVLEHEINEVVVATTSATGTVIVGGGGGGGPVPTITRIDDDVTLIWDDVVGSPTEGRMIGANFDYGENLTMEYTDRLLTAVQTNQMAAAYATLTYDGQDRLTRVEFGDN